MVVPGNGMFLREKEGGSVMLTGGRHALRLKKQRGYSQTVSWLERIVEQLEGGGVAAVGFGDASSKAKGG